MRISATDIDDGKNGSISYSLRPDSSSPRDIDFFEVVPKSGEVKLRKPIDDVIFFLCPLLSFLFYTVFHVNAFYFQESFATTQG